jgi:hypothetical protein
MTVSLVQSAVRVARTRLIRQAFLNRVSVALAIGVAVALVWFFIQPLLLDSAPGWLRWSVLAGSALLALSYTLWQTRKQAPTQQDAALEVDSRLKLRERVVTATVLPTDQRATSAGQAMLADAEAHLRDKNVANDFPVSLRWTAAVAPVLALALIAVVLFWNPAAIDFNTLLAGDKKGATTKQNGQDVAKKPAAAAEVKKPQEELPKSKNEKLLAEIDADLKRLNEKYDKSDFEKNPEKALEKTAELTKLEEKTLKFTKEKELELKQLADKLAQLEKLGKKEEFKDGPANELNDALSKGEIDKAEDEIDELKKKVDKDELTKKEKDQLADQLEKMKDELTKQKEEVERLNRDKEEKQDELQKEIDKAKQEGREQDAEELERELEKSPPPQKDTEEQLKDLADQLGKAQQGMEKGDKQEAGEALQKAKQSVQKMKKSVDQLAKGEQQAEKLKRERQESAKSAQGEKGEKGEGQKSAQGEKGEGEKTGQAQAGGEKGDQPGDELTKSKSGPNKGGIGAGQRNINEDAKTGSEEARIRSLQDLKGKSTFGGLTKGDGFTKKSDKELGQSIRKAAQDAPNASDVQTLPRDARDSVAEYFKKLGSDDKKK